MADKGRKMTPTLEPAVTRAERLMARELALREATREAELADRVDDAQRYHTQAQKTRRMRLALLRRIGVHR